MPIYLTKWYRIFWIHPIEFCYSLEGAYRFVISIVGLFIGNNLGSQSDDKYLHRSDSLRNYESSYSPSSIFFITRRTRDVAHYYFWVCYRQLNISVFCFRVMQIVLVLIIVAIFIIVMLMTFVFHVQVFNTGFLVALTTTEKIDIKL